MFKFSRRDVLRATTAAASGVLLNAEKGITSNLALQHRKPNVVFIVADDLGYADVGCYGSRENVTPHVDALASSGMRLTNGYANSCVCSATRIGLITGRYQDRFPAGLELPLGPPELGLPSGINTMPGVFRSLGYRTALVGKWHMGVDPGVRPRDHGYDRFFGIYGGATDYYRYAEMDETGRLMEDGIPLKEHRYLTDLFGEKAVDLIGGYAAEDQPFFLSFHFTTPHWPWQVPESPPSSSGPVDEEALMEFDGGNLETYSRMVENMDDNVGRIVGALEAHGLSDNTIVVFTSDNGGERFSDTWPLTGIKTELLEGGIRVPLIVKWPAEQPEARVSGQVMMSMDFMPTLLSAAGYPIVDRLNVDGQDLSEHLFASAPKTDRTVFWRYKARSQRAVRSGHWKYLAIDGEEYLFDLSYDQRERANLKDKDPARLDHLKGMYAQWESQMLPYPDDSYAHDLREKLADR